MARIRTIKPEFWDSPSTTKASPWARLLFIAMWNWADDYGRGTANLKELEGFAFPYDDTFADKSGNTVQFRDVVAEVSECFGVTLYEVDGRPYYAIPTWEEHQRNERRAKQSKYPGPEVSPQVSPAGRNMHGISATPERKAPETPNSSVPGTGEQGNRGTGEQGNRGTNAQPSVARAPSSFPEWWAAWGKKKAKGDAEKAYKAAVPKKISHDDLMVKTRAYWDHVKATGTDLTYVPYPATWLRAEQWDDDLTVTTQSGGRPPQQEWMKYV